MLKRFKTNRVFEIDYDAPLVVLDKHVLGKRVRECRKARGLTQEELGIAIDSSQNEIHRIESGKYLLSLYMLIRICNALEYPVDVILRGYVQTTASSAASLAASTILPLLQ